MGDPKPGPGPVADHTFDFGFRAIALLGVVVVLASYALGLLPFHMAAYTLLFIFPVVMVFVSLLLARWLGYDTNRGNLEPARVSEADTSWKDWPW